jgi:hypothetical protein
MHHVDIIGCYCGFVEIQRHNNVFDITNLPSSFRLYLCFSPFSIEIVSAVGIPCIVHPCMSISSEHAWCPDESFCEDMHLTYNFPLKSLVTLRASLSFACWCWSRWSCRSVTSSMEKASILPLWFFHRLLCTTYQKLDLLVTELDDEVIERSLQCMSLVSKSTMNLYLSWQKEYHIQQWCRKELLGNPWRLTIAVIVSDILRVVASSGKWIPWSCTRSFCFIICRRAWAVVLLVVPLTWIVKPVGMARRLINSKVCEEPGSKRIKKGCAHRRGWMLSTIISYQSLEFIWFDLIWFDFIARSCLVDQVICLGKPQSISIWSTNDIKSFSSALPSIKGRCCP